MMREVCHGELDDMVMELCPLPGDTEHEYVGYVEYAETEVRHRLAKDSLPPPFDFKLVNDAENVIRAANYPRFGYLAEPPLDVIKAWYEWQGRQIELRKKVIISWRMRDV